jgi:hypothetical protein
MGMDAGPAIGSFHRRQHNKRVNNKIKTGDNIWDEKKAKMSELDWILVLWLEKVLCADAMYRDDPRADHHTVVLLACEISSPVHLTRVLPWKTNLKKFYQKVWAKRNISCYLVIQSTLCRKKKSARLKFPLRHWKNFKILKGNSCNEITSLKIWQKPNIWRIPLLTPRLLW